MSSWGTAVDDSSAQLVSYLRPGEQLLWSGRPDPDVWFSPADVFLVPFSIMWGGFAVIWELGAISSGAGFLVLWGIPFVAIGLHMMFGRFIYKHRTKLRTAYGLTPDRALVAVGTKALNDSPLKQTPSSIRRSRDGSHVSVTFGNPNGWTNRGAYGNTGMEFFARGNAPFAFYDVADGEALLAALDRARGK
jgi:hypothetical protein